METKLARISEISTKRPNTKFSSIGHLINAEMLRECHNEMKSNKAVGIDGVTQILVGYYHYYGITDNGNSLSRMKRKVEEMLFFWLNRRSQRKSYSWKQYRMLLEAFGLEKPKIYINIYG